MQYFKSYNKIIINELLINKQKSMHKIAKQKNRIYIISKAVII